MLSATARDDGDDSGAFALRSGLPLLAGIALVAVPLAMGGDVWTLLAASLGVPYLATGVAAAALSAENRDSVAIAALPTVATVVILTALLGESLLDPVQFSVGVALAGVIVALAFPLGYARRSRDQWAFAVAVAGAAAAIVGITADMVLVPRLDDPPLPVVVGAGLALGALAVAAPLYVLGDKTSGGDGTSRRHVPALAAALLSITAAGAGVGIFFAIERWLLFEGIGRVIAVAAALLVGLPFVVTAVGLARALRAPSE